MLLCDCENQYWIVTQCISYRSTIVKVMGIYNCCMWVFCGDMGTISRSVQIGGWETQTVKVK